MQEFYINKNSTLPYLKMDLINNGVFDYNKFYELIQNSKITFSMVNAENGVTKISNAEATIQPKEGCSDAYFICYKWNIRDTKIKGKYLGKFTITFGSLDPNYKDQKLIVPIQEELVIYIQ